MLTKKTPKLSTGLSGLAPLKSLVARYAKLLALLFGFGLCLIRILALVGGPHNGSEVGLDASWLMSLPTTLAQNEWLGRDIYFT